MTLPKKAPLSAAQDVPHAHAARISAVTALIRATAKLDCPKLSNRRAILKIGQKYAFDTRRDYSHCQVRLLCQSFLLYGKFLNRSRTCIARPEILR